jgi:hypothetical protein
VPTAQGLLYFKEMQPSLAHEARLIEILAERHPQLVTDVVASDAAGRMLMRDAGPQLSAILPHNRDLRYWEQALPLYAQLQVDVAEDAAALLEAGAFDRRSSVLPALYEQLVAERAEGLTTEEHTELLELEPRVSGACEGLSAHPVPETINNDDLTDGSIHLQDGRYRFLDWGDACVSHPFLTLTVTLRVIELRHELEPGSKHIARLRDAYLEPFTRYAPLSELVPLADEARWVGQICRAALRAENPDWDEPEELAWSLRLLLDPEAWRDWVTEDEQPPRQGPVS